MKYLTPATLRVLGTGLQMEDVPDSDLAGWIETAESLIDEEMGFDEQNSLGFAPGIRHEKQSWDPATRRVNPTSIPVPVQTVNQFNIVVSQNPGTGTYVLASVRPTLVIINNDYGYLESVDLAVALYSIAPILAQLGMMEPFVDLIYTASYQEQKYNHRLYYAINDNGTIIGDNDASLDIENIASFQSRIPFWDSTQPVTVTQNGNVVPINNYYVNYDDGSITFQPQFILGSRDVIKTSFTHLIPDPISKICVYAVYEVAGEHYLNRDGMTGYSSAKSGARLGTRRLPQLYTWRQSLTAFKQPRIGMA